MVHIVSHTNRFVFLSPSPPLIRAGRFSSDEGTRMWQCLLLVSFVLVAFLSSSSSSSTRRFLAVAFLLGTFNRLINVRSCLLHGRHTRSRRERNRGERKKAAAALVSHLISRNKEIRPTTRGEGLRKTRGEGKGNEDDDSSGERRE